MELMAFARKPGENVNSLLSRYETVRQRAALEGQFVMSVEGCSVQILRACGIGPQHLFTLLQPFQGQLPRTDQQFNQLCTQLRRYGHISENAPGNVAAALHGQPRQARPGAYLAEETQLALRDATQRSAHHPDVASLATLKVVEVREIRGTHWPLNPSRQATLSPPGRIAIQLQAVPVGTISAIVQKRPTPSTRLMMTARLLLPHLRMTDTRTQACPT